MTEQELETQCMALSNLVDTEIVSSDPRKIPSFDPTTLYVWLEPVPRGVAPADPQYSNVVHGRLGARDDTADSVRELAKRLGIRPSRPPKAS